MRLLMRQLVIIGLLLLGTITYAKNHHAHIHGEAQVNMVIDTNVIQIELTMPAESILGFEHKPTTKTEIEHLARIKKTLSKTKLFDFYTKKGFFKKESRINLDQKKGQLYFTHDEHHGHNEHHSHEKHSEFTLIIEYKTQKNKPISAIATNLFELFHNLDTITLNVVSSNSNNTKEWTPRQAKVKL